jgi:hypothetical protein
MSEWKEYTGSKAQIVELLRMRHNGVLLRFDNGYETDILFSFDEDELRCTTHYWIIPEDSLRQMKIRQAQTGQPVWYRYIDSLFSPGICTTNSEWSDTYEYSFTPFE